MRPVAASGGLSKRVAVASNMCGAAAILRADGRRYHAHYGQPGDPATRRVANVFDDENLDLLSHLLDDFIRIPGTPIRFGLDGIVGFLPGVGDAIGGIASCIIIFAAWVRGVSYVTLARMLANWGIEVLLGAVPVLGNLFDIAWRANRRNYALLTGSLANPQGVRRRSWLFFAVLCGIFAAMLLVPMLLFAWLSVHLVHIIAAL